MNANVDVFIVRAPQWSEEMKGLRRILLDCDLPEEVTWGKPCHTAEGGNIVIMQPVEQHLSLMFFKGALLKDDAGILRSQGQNTRSAKRVELTSPEQVSEAGPTLKSYVEQAIAVERAGLEVPSQQTDEEDRPPELDKRFDEDPAYEEAFEALTPGRKRSYKRSYLIHFSGSKQAKTREARIERCRSKVLEGKGFNSIQ